MLVPETNQSSGVKSLEIAILESLSDNYIFASLNKKTNEAFCVDPGEAKPVLVWLKEHSAKLSHILCTHHHSDHTGGIRSLLQQFPNTKVIGANDSGRIPCQNQIITPGEKLTINDQECEVIDVHAHTRAHIAYYFPASNDLFSGDTIFAGTCGAIFEGTLNDMLLALKKIRALTAETKIWCAHEYSLMYLENAARVEPWNEDTKARVEVIRSISHQRKPSVPLLLSDEILTNLYLHWDHPYWRETSGMKTELEIFQKIAESDS